MKIALVILPTWSPQTPPLGIASIAGQLLSKGHDVKVYDTNIKLWNKYKEHKVNDVDLWDCSHFLKWQEHHRFKSEILPLIEKDLISTADNILQKNPDIIGFSIFDTSLPTTVFVSDYIRKRNPKVKIIFGGPGANLNRVNQLSKHRSIIKLFDVMVVGEGELSVIEAVDRIANGESFENCMGLAHITEEGRLVSVGIRPNIKLDELPLPYFKDFDFSDYREQKLPIMMSRGCVAKCTFCSETRFWKKYRFREAGHIFNELKENVDEYGLSDFAVADSLVNGNFRVLEELVDLMNGSDYDMNWSGYARIDRRMTAELLGKMKTAGCTHLSYGLETGSQKVMDLMEKRTTVDVAKRVIKETFDAGINVHLNMIVGFPGEEEKDFQDTLDFMNENSEFIHVVNTGEACSIGSDTPLGQQPASFGIKTDKFGNVDYSSGDWVSIDGRNTRPVRRNRLNRLRFHLDQHQNILRFPQTPIENLNQIAAQENISL